MSALSYIVRPGGQRRWGLLSEVTDRRASATSLSVTAKGQSRVDALLAGQLASPAPTLHFWNLEHPA